MKLKNQKNLLLCLNPHYIFEEEKIFYCVESLIIYLREIKCISHVTDRSMIHSFNFHYTGQLSLIL